MLAGLLTTGCGTVARFTGEAGNNYTLYQATRTDLDAIHNCLQPPPHINFGLVPGWLVVPFPIIDLPFAVVVDTVLLPYDTCRYRKAKKAGQEQAIASHYWCEAFQTDTITAEEAARYFTGGTQDQIFLELRDGSVKPNVLTVVYDLAMAQNTTELLVALSAHGGLSQDQCRALYAWQLAGGDSQIQYNLARNPATPLDMLTLFAVSPDELLCWAVADSGRIPWPTLREVLAKSPPEWLKNKRRLAADPATDPASLMGFSMNKYYGGFGIQTAVAANPNTPADGLRRLAFSAFEDVRAAAAANPATPEEVLRSLSNDRDESVRAAAAAILKTPHKTK